MAKPRQRPREAARHTGDAWELGHQLRPDRNFTIDFGPFQGFNTVAPLGQETQWLRRLDDAYVDNGLLVAPFSESDESSSWTDADSQVRPKAFRVDGTDYLFRVYEATADSEIHVERLSSGPNVSDFDSGIVASPNDFTAYGNNLYIVYDGAVIQVYDVSAGTIGNVAGSPSGQEFIWTLDNNLCTADASTIYWAVDGDPTDWSSAGSGSNPIPPEIGGIMGVVVDRGSALIMGTKGAVRMVPTGTLPAFRFQMELEFPGLGIARQAVAAHGKIFYLDRAFRPMLYVNGRAEHVGGSLFSASTGSVSYVESLGAFCFNGYINQAASTLRRAYFFEPDTGIISGLLTTNNGGYVVDVTQQNENEFRVIDLTSTLRVQLWALGGHTATTDPTILTHTINLPHAVQIYRVDLLWGYAEGQTTTEDDPPNPTVAILTQQDDGTEQDADILRRASSETRIIYDANRITDNFALRIDEGAWSQFIFLRGIKVYCSVMATDDIELF